MANQIGAAAPQMFTLDEVAELSRSSRGTIYNRMKAHDDAVAAGQTPPPGSLRSVRWCGKRLIADEWLRASLGLDAPPEPVKPAPPPQKLRPRGRPFQPKSRAPRGQPGLVVMTTHPTKGQRT